MDGAFFGRGCRPKNVKLPHLSTANTIKKMQVVGIQQLTKHAQTGFFSPKAKADAKEGSHEGIFCE